MYPLSGFQKHRQEQTGSWCSEKRHELRLRLYITRAPGDRRVNPVAMKGYELFSFSTTLQNIIGVFTLVSG